MMSDLFITEFATNRMYFFSVVFTVIVSIVLHELAHGWMAILHGDDTPIISGHMTGNPLVHMGLMSFAILLMFGIAWGQMPIDPTRMRGRYAAAKVAAAGPATNLLLAVIALTALGLWVRFGMIGDSLIQQNGLELLLTFGKFNLLLCIFNLLPVPPLDGSHILANFNRGYAKLIYDPERQQIMFFGFIFVFIVLGSLGPYVFDWATTYVSFVAGI